MAGTPELTKLVTRVETHFDRQDAKIDGWRSEVDAAVAAAGDFVARAPFVNLLKNADAKDRDPRSKDLVPPFAYWVGPHGTLVSHRVLPPTDPDVPDDLEAATNVRSPQGDPQGAISFNVVEFTWARRSNVSEGRANIRLIASNVALVVGDVSVGFVAAKCITDRIRYRGRDHDAGELIEAAVERSIKTRGHRNHLIFSTDREPAAPAKVMLAGPFLCAGLLPDGQLPLFVLGSDRTLHLTT
ncbi:MAG: hypothetical protein GDA47_02130 [Rhodospirillales bacterium]|nr:hypothetical protein [Rhodospirillales bacterium]